MKYNHDPMKELNEDFYLNEVALKTRYSLLELNQQNQKDKIETGSHWRKFTPYPVVDQDIKYNVYIQGNKSIDRIIKNNDKIFSNINKSGLKKKLNSIDHTYSLSQELTNERNRRKNHFKTKTTFFFNSNPYLISGNNTLRLYKKSPLKKDYIPFVTNLNGINNKKKKIIYDISPINTKRKRGKCFFPNINSSQNSFENTMKENFKNDFSRNDNNLNERIVTDFSDDKYCKSNKEKKYSIRIIKAKGEPHKVKLKDLAQDLQNLAPANFPKKEKTKILFSKKIIVIDSDKNKKKNHNQFKRAPKYKEFKYFDEDIVTKGAFPKTKYYMNFQYDKGAIKISESNNQMDKIQDVINVKFNDIKKFVTNNIDETMKTMDK